MTRESYQQDLERLTDQILEMGQKALKSFDMALECVLTSDTSIPAQLNAEDDDIDNQYFRIEDHCLDLIALQQPVASDLRLVASVFKIGTDIERIADLAVNVAEYAAESEDFLLLERSDLVDLGQNVRELIARSLDAFRNEDVNEAKAIILEDKKIDQQCLDLENKALVNLIELEGASHEVEEAEKIARNAHTIFRSIRDIERIGDHAGNVCARLIYWQDADSQYI